jgi:hypothetical protein
MSLSRVTQPAAVLLLSLGLAARVWAADAGGASPFLPPAAAAASTAPTQDTALELRGVTALGDSQMFSIYDSGRRMSSWTKLNEVGRDYIVRSYDAAKDTVTVDYQGRTLTLVLHTAKVVSAPVNGPPVQLASPAAPAPQPIGGPVVLNPTPADEQRRLEAIAAEVNRRRMIRQQAMQANRQQAAGQPGQPPPQPQPAPNAQR